ncbi:sensor histidine kinase [Kitasatospora sp. NPDC092948]|uniref:sensor histidine kinase n=1 Tax=Kitasatospora sp. NPDC092948 TaxID=3364088 RepID=UPI00382399F6
MTEEPRPPLTGRLRAAHWIGLDAGLALLLGAVTWRRVLAYAADYRPHGRELPEPAGWQVAVVLGCVVALGVALAVRRVRTTLAVALVAAAWVTVVATAGQLMIANIAGVQVVLTGAAVVYLAAATRSTRDGLIGLGLALAATQLTWFGSYELWHNWLVAALAQLTAWALGAAVGRYRAHDAALRRHQADALWAELTAERIRLARELHDVIAHSMSVVNVQAGYGHFVIDQDPQGAKAALATIRSTSRDALREMRGLLDVLRDGSQHDGSRSVGGGSPSDTAALLPAPTMADLDRLVSSAADAGVRVELTVTGARRELSPALELTVYRIVQEAVTNVVKHAATDTARVRIEYRPDALLLEVGDRGRGAQAAEVEAADGHGLAGMRERVGLYGGTLEAGPRSPRGFRVRALLPTGGAR